MVGVYTTTEHALPCLWSVSLLSVTYLSERPFSVKADSCHRGKQVLEAARSTLNPSHDAKLVEKITSHEINADVLCGR